MGGAPGLHKKLPRLIGHSLTASKGGSWQCRGDIRLREGASSRGFNPSLATHLHFTYLDFKAYVWGADFLILHIDSSTTCSSV